MKKILILMGRYLPGHKDGGPLRTIINLTDALGDEYKFYIACYDRDHGDTKPYPNIRYGKWERVGKTKVTYIRQKGFTFNIIKKLVKDKDSIYLTSFYDEYGYKTLLLKRLGIIKQPVALASMGVFSKGALAQKALKKKVFISLCKLMGLFKNITWSVTSEFEANDVKREISDTAKYIIAEDLPRTNVPGYKKKNGVFSVAFLSRISPKKNLMYAISVLNEVNSSIQFNIYGPDEDKPYWEKCKMALNQLPDNIQWKYHGDVESSRVQEKFAENDVFLFPTLGENYGHVIFEALSVGCIPIISDQTPWESIEKYNAGYIIPLDKKERFSKLIDRISALPHSERIEKAEMCVQLAQKSVEKNRKETGYRLIFD